MMNPETLNTAIVKSAIDELKEPSEKYSEPWLVDPKPEFDPGPRTEEGPGTPSYENSGDGSLDDESDVPFNKIEVDP